MGTHYLNADFYKQYSSHIKYKHYKIVSIYNEDSVSILKIALVNMML